MNEFFTLEQQHGVAHLRLDRPERLNTLTPGFFPALDDVVHTLHEDGQVRVLVISSRGEHFSTGLAQEAADPSERAAGSHARDRRDPHAESLRHAVGDLMHMLDTRAPPTRPTQATRPSAQDALRQRLDCFAALDEARFPVICAVQGDCIGAALDLAAACDIRVCSVQACFSVQDVEIGRVADLGTLQRLARLVPPGVVRQMAYSGERVEAPRALAIGLVNAVLPDACALLAHAMALARSIAARSPLAVAGSKLALNHARDHGSDAPWSDGLTSSCPEAPSSHRPAPCKA